MIQKKLLITGFDPFGGESINPSWEAVKGLPERIVCNGMSGAMIGAEESDDMGMSGKNALPNDANVEYALTKLRIPVIFGQAAETVLDAARILQSDVILCVGQAGGRGKVTPEVIGINLRESMKPDNAGVRPAGVPIVEDGPAAYFSTVPVRKMVSAIEKTGIPSALSYSAGVFVCNDVLYSLLHHYQGTQTRVGFVHVPFLPEQVKAGEPSMLLEDVEKALEAAIAVLG